MIRLPRPERRSTWSLMVARATTEKGPGPVSASRISGWEVSRKAARMAATAADWPSVFAPSARVRASSRARSPSREAQTPSASCGRGLLPMASSSCMNSPLGSRGSKALLNSPAEVASRSMLSATPARRPSTVKRSAFIAGLNR